LVRKRSHSFSRCSRCWRSTADGPEARAWTKDEYQSGRRYFWWASQLPLPAERINAHSVNRHLIPADEDIATRLKAVRCGEIISLRGYLVAVQAPNGWSWRSSLSRADQGDGASEVIWVEGLTIRE
jgi:hypothetical protein